MTYTAKKIADILGRPATTIRTWADKYKDFIPLGDKKSGRRRYNDEGLAVFKKIAQLHNNDVIGEDVKEELSKAFPIQADGDVSIGDEVSENALVVRREYQETINYFSALLKKNDELIALQREELGLLKEALGLRKEKGVNPFAEPYRSRHIAIHRKLAKRKLDKVDTKKRVFRVNKKGSVKKKKGWLEKLFS